MKHGFVLVMFQRFILFHLDQGNREGQGRL